MKYSKLYSCKAVTPNALFSIIQFKELFIEFRLEKLSQQVSEFTKVSPQQSFSTLSIYVIVLELKSTQKFVFIVSSVVSKAGQ